MQCPSTSAYFAALWEFLWRIFFVSSLGCWHVSICMDKSSFHIIWTLRRSFQSFNEMSPQRCPSVLSCWSLKFWNPKAFVDNERWIIIEFRILSHPVSDAGEAFKILKKFGRLLSVVPFCLLPAAFWSDWSWGEDWPSVNTKCTIWAWTCSNYLISSGVLNTFRYSDKVILQSTMWTDTQTPYFNTSASQT